MYRREQCSLSVLVTAITHEALDIMNFKELAIHHDEICESLFDSIINDNNYRL